MPLPFQPTPTPARNHCLDFDVKHKLVFATPEFVINGITQYAFFCIWFEIIHVLAHIVSGLFLFIAEYIPFYKYTPVYSVLWGVGSVLFLFFTFKFCKVHGT